MHKIPDFSPRSWRPPRCFRRPWRSAQDAKSKAAPARPMRPPRQDLYSQAYFDFMLKQRTAQGQPDTPELRTAVRDELNTRELAGTRSQEAGHRQEPGRQDRDGPHRRRRCWCARTWPTT